MKTRNATESDDRTVEANLNANIESLNSAMLEGYFLEKQLLIPYIVKAN